MKTKGFTLIELLVVIAIISMIGAIIIPVVNYHRDTNRLQAMGLMRAKTIYYNPDTKEIVEVSDDLRSIRRIIGKITVPLLVFENLNETKQRESIEYYACKPYTVTNDVTTISVNGVKYIKAE